MRDGKCEYTIRAYEPPNQGGGLLIETVHVGTASRDMELAVFYARMRRGEVARLEVIAHVEPYGTTTIYTPSPAAEGETYDHDFGNPRNVNEMGTGNLK